MTPTKFLSPLKFIPDVAPPRDALPKWHDPGKQSLNLFFGNLLPGKHKHLASFSLILFIFRT